MNVKKDKFLIVLFCILALNLILFPPEIYNLSYSKIIVPAALILVFVILSFERISQIYFISFFSLIIILIIHSFFAPNVNLNNILLFVSYLIILFVLQEVITKQNINIILRFISAIAFILSLYAVYQFFWGYKLAYLELLPFKEDFLVSKTLVYLKNRRVSATFSLPTSFAAFQMMTLPFLLYNIRINLSFISKLGYYVILFLTIFSSMLSQSYFICISFLVMIVMVLLLKRAPLSKKLSLLAFAILIIIAILFSLYVRKDISLNILKANTVKMRLGNWRIAVDIIRNNLLWGVGIGNFHLYYPKFMTTADIETKYAHNFLLQLSAELGILGIFSSLLLLFLLIKSFLKIRKSDENSLFLWAICSSTFIFVAYSLIDISFYFPSIGIYGLLIIAIYIAEHKRLTDLLKHSTIPISNFVKIMIVSLIIIILIHTAQFHYAESLNEKSYNQLIKGENKDAFMLINKYLKLFKTDVAAANIMIDTIKDEKSINNRVQKEEIILQYFPFSPKTHYMIGKLNLNDYRYYDAFINFYIAYYLYPNKNAYKEAYLKSLEFINLVSN